MTENKRFYIDCYGIIDTYKKGEGCHKKLTWSELTELLNELYENVDTDKQEILLRNRELTEENRKLKDLLTRIVGMIENENRK